MVSETWISTRWAPGLLVFLRMIQGHREASGESATAACCPVRVEPRNPFLEYAQSFFRRTGLSPRPALDAEVRTGQDKDRYWERLKREMEAFRRAECDNQPS